MHVDKGHQSRPVSDYTLQQKQGTSTGNTHPVVKTELIFTVSECFIQHESAQCVALCFRLRETLRGSGLKEYVMLPLGLHVASTNV